MNIALAIITVWLLGNLALFLALWRSGVSHETDDRHHLKRAPALKLVVNN